MYSRRDIEFNSDEIFLRGWFYSPPENYLPAPCIIMTNGFSALKEHYLDKFAKHFANAGMCVLVYDNRNFGDSDGQPRLEVDHVLQMRDMRNAITFVQGSDFNNIINPEKIGLWGTSFSGGVVIAVSAVDKRVSCVVSQVPFVSGHHKFLRSNRPEQWEGILKKYNDDRSSRLAGNPPSTIAVVTDSPDKPAIMKTQSAYSFFTSVPSWENKVTLRSVENSGEFEPISYIERIGPTPLLFIVANNDTINSTDLALKAYAKAHEPKHMSLIEGDHFSPYEEQFDVCINSASRWFEKHLLGKIITPENEVATRRNDLIMAKL